MQEDGNLVLYNTAYQADSSNPAYWSSNTEGSGYELVFNESGQVYLTARNESIIDLIHFSGSSTDEFYQRVVLEHDGVFMQYVYPKSSNSGRPMNWTTAASKPIPDNICLVRSQNLGSGPCGFNTICTLGNDQRPTCNCPPQGYVWLDPEDHTKGCRQDFAPQSCDMSKPDQDKFELQEMINTNWPLSDYEMYPNQTEDWCRQSCLSDCFCALAIYGFSNCWKKRIPLSNGKTHESIEGKALIKVRTVNSTQAVTECQKKDSISKPVIIIGSTLLSGLVILNLLLVILTLATCRSLRSRKMVSDRPKNYKMATEEESEMILVEWVSDCYRAGSLDPLVADDEEATGDRNGVERFVRTALWCIQEDPSQRPTMKKVSLMLEGAIPVPIPPDPCSFISSI
ncbi:hypothetical protein MLD38_017140 [Melastoma candidum]|uniref:Uncharacterized protein n=1 Tax=Melastoma candidum TaxID=119954 RepID=A0ACB9QTQ6_9MYRT|nr:hypothetical protein MLD38_017140 [Melastoma candidum]